MDSTPNGNLFKRYFCAIVLASFFMLYPLKGGDTLNLGFTPSAIAIFMLASALAWKPKIAPRFGITDALVILYMLTIILSSFNASSNVVGNSYLLQIVSLSIIPYGCIRMFGFSYQDARSLIAVFPAVSLIAACTMLSIVGIDEIMAMSGYRMGTEDINSVGIGWTFGLAGLFSTVSINLRLCNIIVGLAALIASVTIVVLTGSRGPMLTAIACLLGLLVSWRRLDIRTTLGLLALTVTGTYVFGELSDTMVADRFVNAADSYSVSARLVSWDEAWEMFSTHPFSGAGLGTFEATYGEYVHNIVLEHMANGGLLLFVPIMLLIISIFFQSFDQLMVKRNLVIGSLAMMGVYCVVVRLFSLSMANTKELFVILAIMKSCADSTVPRRFRTAHLDH